jgi:hypothetical protein
MHLSEAWKLQVYRWFVSYRSRCGYAADMPSANMHSNAVPSTGKKSRKRSASFAGTPAPPSPGPSTARVPATPTQIAGFGGGAKRTPSPQYDSGVEEDPYYMDALRDAALQENANVVIDYSPPLSPSALAGAAPPFSHLAQFAQLHQWTYPKGSGFYGS